MSAADVIAEALLAYWVDADGGRVGRPPDGHSREMSTAVLAALSAAGYVVATPEEIRAWPVEQQAELIGGEVARQYRTKSERGRVRPERGLGSWVEFVVGPWAEVQP